MIGELLATALSLFVLGVPLDAPFAGERRQSVFVTAALDPALLFGVGCGHTLKFRGEGAAGFHRLTLAHDVRTVPSFTSWEFRASAGARLLERRGFDLMGGMDLELKTLTNPVHAGVSLVPRLSVLPGYFGDSWFVAGELDAQFMLGSVIWHTERYREAFPEVSDGFLGPGAWYWFGGAKVGALLGPVVADLRFSYRFPADFVDQAPYLVPYILELRVGYRF